MTYNRNTTPRYFRRVLVRELYPVPIPAPTPTEETKK